jgi:phosphatidylinositol alpha-1,6-mannosyltransferase
MVAIEAAAHGLPTVAFDIGGVADAIADGRSGWLVPAGDYAGYIQRVIQVLDTGRSAAVEAACRSFAEAFAWSSFGSKMTAALRHLIGTDKSM